LQKWIEQGVLGSVLEALAEDLEERGEIDLSECYIDATFVAAKGERVGKTKRGKGTKIMAFSDGSSIPLAIYTEVLHHTKSPLFKRLSPQAF
jgi:hypothetical protein